MLRPLLAALAVCSMIRVAEAHVQTCRASWYGEGSKTASGERFHPATELTAAMPSFRFGMKPWKVRVTNLANGHAVVVRVNDKGPAPWTGKCIDVSTLAAIRLGMTTAGVAVVHIEVI